MLYRTHHLSFLQFPSATTTTSLSPSSSSVVLQVEMECVEAALKSSFRKEMAPKSSPQGFLFDDLWALNVPTGGGASYDDFSVDELLDFSNEDGFVVGEEEEEEPACARPPASPAKNRTEEEDKSGESCRNFADKDDFGPVPAAELGVPVDDLASLEWLSHFVDDSNSEYSAPFPVGALAEKPKTEPEKMVLTEDCFKTPVPARARSKRARTGVRVWSLGSPSLTESSSSSTTTSSSSSSSPSSPWLVCGHPGLTLDPPEPVSFEKPPVKKQKKKLAAEGVHGGAPPRRCSHCGVQKTPQWRAGPLGAKTLCNACGVRYKSGRLLPEYRPACSPTFSSELHSNHHRKVLEMRKQKDTHFGPVEPGVAPPVVPSF